jgi:predicted transcriptional regulator
MPKLTKFFERFRKAGYGFAIDILFDPKKKEGLEFKETDFFELIKKRNSYQNNFYRSKKELLKDGIIAYKLDENYDKVVYLTEKGVNLKKKLIEIDELLKTETT